MICGELSSLSDRIECLDILGAKKVKMLVYEIIRGEKKIEEAYQSLTLGDIEKLSKFVDFRLAVIGNLKEDKMRCYHRTISNAKLLDSEVSEEDFELLGKHLMECDPFYDLNRYIDYRLDNEFQRAIFDMGSLSYDRLLRSMDAMWAYKKPDLSAEIEPIDPEAAVALIDEEMMKAETYEDEFDDEDDYSDDEDYDDADDIDRVDVFLYDKKIYMTFYLNYIRHIDWYQTSTRYDPILERSRRGLLYLLDGYGNNLYQEDNFKKALLDTSMEEIDYQEDFSDFYVMSRLFLVDILEGFLDDAKSLRKLLFVSTYYDLTKDKRIEKIMHKYQKTEIGEDVSKAILNHNYTGCDFSSESSKK